MGTLSITLLKKDRDKQSDQTDRTGSPDLEARKLETLGPRA